MRAAKYLIFILIITSCNTPRVVYDYNERVDFSAISSYQIYFDLVSNLNQLDEERIITAIEEELHAKDLRVSDKPDIYVNFYGSTYEAYPQNRLGVGVGGGGRNVGVGASGGIPLGGPETYMRLTIDIIDVQKGSLIWQAIAEGKVDKTGTPERRKEQLKRLVKSAFKNYPPE